MLTFDKSESIAVTATTGAFSTQQLTNMHLWDATFVITDATPAAKTFVRLSGNSFTITAHGFKTGLKVVNTTTSALPTGLTGAPEYVIVINANTVQFATSQALALAGTAITISGDGMGVQTSTPQALAGTLVAQKSNETVPPDTAHNWFTLTTPTSAASQVVSATGSLNYYDPACGYPFVRFLLTVTSGQCSATLRLNAKGI